MCNLFGCCPTGDIAVEEKQEVEEKRDFFGEIFEFLRENAPMVATAGGIVASFTIATNPSLPMTTAASGTPPGTFLSKCAENHEVKSKKSPNQIMYTIEKKIKYLYFFIQPPFKS